MDQFKDICRRIMFLILVFSLNSFDSIGQGIGEIVLPIGHDGVVQTADYSPVGDKIITTSVNRMAFLWDASNGRPLFYLNDTGGILLAKFSPCGKKIVTAGYDNSLSLWDATNGNHLLKIGKHYDHIQSVEFSHDGKRIVSASSDSRVRIWDADSGSLLLQINGHKYTGFIYEVYSAHFSSDGNHLLTVSEDNTSKLWNARTGSLLATFRHKGTVFSGQFSPDGKKVVTSSADSTTKVWSVIDGKLMLEIDDHSSYCMSAQFSPDGLKIMTLDAWDSIANIWDSESGDHLFSLKGHSNELNMAAFSPDGTKIATCSVDCTAKVWEAKSGKLLYDLVGHIDEVRYVRFSPNGNKIITTSDDKTSKVWDANTGRLLMTLKSNTLGINSASFDSNGKKIVVAYDDTITKIWNLEHGISLLNLVGHKKSVSEAQFCNDSLIVTTSEDSTIKIWNVENGSLHYSFSDQLSGNISAYTIPNSRYVISVSKTYIPIGVPIDTNVLYPLIRIWDVISGNLLATINTKLQYYGYYVKRSMDDQYFATILHDTICIRNIINGNEVLSISENEVLIKRQNERLRTVDFSPCGKEIVVSGDDRIIVFCVITGKVLIDKYVPNVRDAKYSPDGKYILIRCAFDRTKICNAVNGELIRELNDENELILNASWDPKGKHVITATSEDIFRISDFDSMNQVQSFKMNGTFEAINFNAKTIISCNNSVLSLYDIKEGKEIFSWVSIGINDYIFRTPDGYYFSTKEALKLITFNVDNIIYSFDQFDLKYNRPDIILERLGYASEDLINSYHKAYLKRLKKMGFKEEDLGEDFHVPETEIMDFEYMPIIEQDTISLDLNFNDSKYNLDRYNIWINDVAIFGVRGKSLKSLKTDSYRVKEGIKLSEGSNKIQVSCLNEKGAESYKETVEVRYEPQSQKKHDLYILIVSVSDYLQSNYNLKYAVKDGRDLVNLYSANTFATYNNIYIDTLFNSNVTIDNVKALKQKLLKTSVNDQVILYVSGHGLLDDNLDFYFASYNMDFNDPGKNGISYDVLEDLLDSIPARKKLFLMDACHSGEVDKEELEVVTDTTVLLADGTKSGLKTYSYRSAKTKTSAQGEGKLGLQNSFELMQELFTNLNRGSGAQVISAAAGDSYALESSEWNNGVFTYAILNGLKNNAADKNQDGEVTVSELRSYVVDEVQRLTDGRQKPTSRQENVEFDFRVW